MDISIRLLLIFFTHAFTVQGFWRLPCMKQTGIARVDPLVANCAISDHTHTIHGGQNFGVKIDSDVLLASNCTSCAIDKDLSVYWTPPLYFQHDNGTVVRVEQVGGMLAYYFNNNGDLGEKIHAFPTGFAMISGDARQRNFTLSLPIHNAATATPDDTTQLALQQKSLGFNCLHYNRGNEDALARFNMPDKAFLNGCTDGLRLEIQFPSCWNGRDVDTPNHRDHVKFPTNLKTGDCPEGFKTRLPVLFYETIYAVHFFAEYPGTFLLANGDPTGYSYHGDFINGWDVDFLQEALDTCTNERGSGEVEDCPTFNGHIKREKPDCKFEMPAKILNEDVDGPLEFLPGKVVVRAGPEYAPPAKGEPLNDSPVIDPPVIESPTPVIAPESTSASPITDDGRYTTTSIYPIATGRVMINGTVVEVITVQEDIIIETTTTVYTLGLMKRAWPTPAWPARRWFG